MPSFSKPPLLLGPEFRLALEALEEEGKNLFVTGRAGTGKSTLLRLFRQMTRKRVAVLAPTGIAALNVGGQTIHSFFGFPPRLLQSQDIRKKRSRKIYQKLDLLIIDEISMVRADMLDAIDLFLRKNREKPEPFGGVQIAFFGDLFQLPPVVADPIERQHLQMQYDFPYFFSAHVFQRSFPLLMWELQKVFRQENRQFLELLEDIRMNTAGAETLAALNRRYDPDFSPGEFYVTLTARNATANAINQKALNDLPGTARIYSARTSGNFRSSLYPTEAFLALKPGAQVMCIKNDPEGAFVNGTLGKIVRLETDSVTIEVEENGQSKAIEIVPMEWEILRYKYDSAQPDQLKTEVLGSFIQLPLRLAWAITIHKAQGKTFERVILDLGTGAFETGQTYVALSRCTSLEGLVLKKRLKPSDIRTDPRIIDYYQQNR